MKPITIFSETPQGKKPVGRLEKQNGQLTFSKTVVSTKHRHRALNAYGLDADTFDQLPDVEVISIHEKDTGKTLSVGAGTFRTKSIQRDFGYGRQYFLPLSYWTIESKNEPRLFAINA